LSHAPPVFAADVAIITALTIAPGKNPASIFGPKINPIKMGVAITYIKINLLKFLAQSSNIRLL